MPLLGATHTSQDAPLRRNAWWGGSGAERLIPELTVAVLQAFTRSLTR